MPGRVVQSSAAVIRLREIEGYHIRSRVESRLEEKKGARVKSRWAAKLDMPKRESAPPVQRFFDAPTSADASCGSPMPAPAEGAAAAAPAYRGVSKSREAASLHLPAGPDWDALPSSLYLPNARNAPACHT
jgi:hypothetical protein